ncbi:MAG: hypothetical protein KIT70_09335 [Anaerolineales bacterium]|nr:MAG: hypothetical protein KIT70_09335 [Anaerolineales bacterium]
MDSIEVKGFWWLPGKTSKKLPGELVYSVHDGAHLSLLGTFEKPTRTDANTPEIILGISQEGTAYTLYNLIPTKISWSFFRGSGQSTYFAHFVFEGVHFRKPGEIKFHKLQARYADLDAWVDTFGFKLDHNLSKSQKRSRQSIAYSLPKSRLVNLPDKTSVGITFRRKGPTWNIVQTEATITQETYLVVKANKRDVSFFDLNKKLGRFSDLLQLASQSLATPKELVGFTKRNVEHVGEKKEPYYPPVKVYYQPIEIPKNIKSKTQHDFLFGYKELTNQQIVKWFQAYENHETQIHLYRTLVYNDKNFAETRFLNIVQALEALHSSLYKSHVIDPQIFAQRREEVLATAPPKLKVWLSETIGDNNYKRLKQRIQELFSKKDALFEAVIQDPDQFALRIRATRNQFIHQREHKASLKHGKELMCATILLKYLFEAYLLQLTGFGSTRIQKIYKKRINKYRSWGVIF